MVGIYKITNKLSGKCYIGQSNNIERRFKEHQQKGEKSRIPVDIAIKKYGKDTFTYEVLEECDISQLNERETYYINLYHSNIDGYNCNTGGEQQTAGEQNGRAKLTINDIIIIRQAYANHKKQSEIYKMFANKVSFNHFQNIWQGRSWSNIMPEVYTEENKKYYIYQNSIGSNGAFSALSDEEVIHIRQRYVNESAKEIYEDYKDRLKYQTLQQILWGRSYSNLPIYKKKEKKWINI